MPLFKNPTVFIACAPAGPGRMQGRLLRGTWTSTEFAETVIGTSNVPTVAIQLRKREMDKGKRCR